MAGPDNIPAPFQTLQMTLEFHPGKENICPCLKTQMAVDLMENL